MNGTDTGEAAADDPEHEVSQDATEDVEGDVQRSVTSASPDDATTRRSDD